MTEANFHGAEDENPDATYNDVIGGSDSDGLADLTGAEEDGGVDAVLATHPSLSPIGGGDISEAPAAQPGTRGDGTGADTGTGTEIGQS